ncbi:MAG: cytochrome ubiquinol oxidase subunit I, partial [Desulfobacteraceae bacterium]|nr:cytochrome ubiquinol oxidase subunit I [Desulfobacteraceae bacterium]
VSSILVAITGDLHAVHVTQTQPAKLAAMESHWETQTQAPIVMVAIPDEKNERNAIEIGRLPGALSLLGHHDVNAAVTGLKDIPKDERPPVLPTFISFRTMVALGTLFPLLTIVGLFLKNRLLESRWYLWVMLLAIPLPYLAIEMGWVLAEVGRQPWIVYGLLKTADAASPVAATQVMTSLVGFVLVYGLLGIAGFYLIADFAKKGPAAADTKAANG